MGLPGKGFNLFAQKRGAEGTMKKALEDIVKISRKELELTIYENTDNNEQYKSIATAVDAYFTGLRDEISAGQREIEWLKGRVKGMEDGMALAKAALERLQPAESAQDLIFSMR